MQSKYNSEVKKEVDYVFVLKEDNYYCYRIVMWYKWRPLKAPPAKFRA